MRAMTPMRGMTAITRALTLAVCTCLLLQGTVRAQPENPGTGTEPPAAVTPVTAPMAPPLGVPNAPDTPDGSDEVEVTLTPSKVDADSCAPLDLTPGALLSAATDEFALATPIPWSEFEIQGQLVDPEQKSLVDTMGIQLDKQLNHGTDPGASTYPRIGQLVAIAVANQGNAGGPADEDAAAVRQSLAAAKLLSVPAGHPQTAPLVLVVLGNPLDQPIADGVLAGLGAGARGVVAVAPTQDANLAGLAADGVTKRVTTVDGSETDAGRVAAVLGLVRAWSTRGGAFGASGADGAVPLG